MLNKALIHSPINAPRWWSSYWTAMGCCKYLQHFWTLWYPLCSCATVDILFWQLWNLTKIEIWRKRKAMTGFRKRICYETVVWSRRKAICPELSKKSLLICGHTISRPDVQSSGRVLVLNGMPDELCYSCSTFLSRRERHIWPKYYSMGVPWKKRL